MKEDMMTANSPKPRLTGPMESSWRGAVIPLILNQFTKKRAFLLPAGIITGLHLLNMLNPEVQQTWVFNQVIWAFGLGILYAWILAEFRTLIPLIILTYLVTALVGVWFGDFGAGILLGGLFGVPFFGLVPAGVVFL